MSLMDPDKIQSFLISACFEKEVENSKLQAAIDLLERNGFIETFKTETYFRIHRLTQDVIKLYRVKRGEINNHEIENKLLSVLNKNFVSEIDFRGILSKREHNVVSHVFSLLKIPYTSFDNKNIHMELQFKYQIFCLRALDIMNDDGRTNDHTNIIYIILQALNKLPYEDIKLKIFNSLIYYYQNADPLFASEFLEIALRMIEKLYSNKNVDEKHITIALFIISKIYHQTDRNFEALVKAEELVKISKNSYSKFFGLSLIIKIKCKLNQLNEAKPLFDELVILYKSHNYGDAIEKEYDKLFILVGSASALGYYEIALKYALDALDIYLNRLHLNDPELAEIYLEIAKCYKNCNDSSNTEKFLNESIEIMDKHNLMDDQSFCIQNLKAFGELYFFSKQYNEALKYYSKYYSIIKEKKPIYRSIGTPKSYLLELDKCKLELGKCYLELGNSDDGLRTLKELIENISSQKAYEQSEDQLLEIVFISRNKEMYENLIILIEEALERIRKIPGQNELIEKAKTELIVKAERELEKCKNNSITCKEYESSPMLLEAANANNLSNKRMNEALLHVEEALKCRKKVLEIYDKCFENLDRKEKVVCYDEIATFCEILSKGENDESKKEEFRKQTQENRKKSLEMNHRLNSKRARY